MSEYFTDDELSCPCCGKNEFKPWTRQKLNNLRSELGYPVILSSAYRCEEYNKKNGYTQTHATGEAVDIPCSHARAYEVIRLALRHGFTGIGIKQKGPHNKRFIHLDTLPVLEGRPRPTVWTYDSV